SGREIVRHDPNRDHIGFSRGRDFGGAPENRDHSESEMVVIFGSPPRFTPTSWQADCYAPRREAGAAGESTRRAVCREGDAGHSLSEWVRQAPHKSIESP